MLFRTVTRLCALALILAPSPARAQERPPSCWSLGVVWRRGAGHQVGPEIRCETDDPRVLNVRAEFSLVARVDRDPIEVVNPNSGGSFATPEDGRRAAILGLAGFSAVLGPRRNRDLGWYGMVGAGFTIVRWGEGMVFDLDSPPWFIDPEGTTTIMPVTTFGIGREFGALGGRNRFEFRIDRYHDEAVPFSGARLSFTRIL